MNHQPSFISESQIVNAVGKVALDNSSQNKRESMMNVSGARDSMYNNGFNKINESPNEV